MQPQQCPHMPGPNCRDAVKLRPGNAGAHTPHHPGRPERRTGDARSTRAPGAHRYPPNARSGLSYGCAAPAAGGPAPCGAAAGGSGGSCSRAAPARRAGAGKPAAPTAAKSSSCSAGPALPEPWPRSAQHQPARPGPDAGGRVHKPAAAAMPAAPCALWQRPVAVAGNAQNNQGERCSSFSGGQATARYGAAVPALARGGSDVNARGKPGAQRGPCWPRRASMPGRPGGLAGRARPRGARPGAGRARLHGAAADQDGDGRGIGVGSGLFIG
jgi:hypothetical protein